MLLRGFRSIQGWPFEQRFPKAACSLSMTSYSTPQGDWTAGRAPCASGRFPVRAGTGGADEGHFKWPGGAEPEASLQIRGQAGPPRPAGVLLSRLDCSQDPTLQTKAEGEDQPSSSW